jgi:hypothetical protein
MGQSLGRIAVFDWLRFPSFAQPFAPLLRPTLMPHEVVAGR